MQMQQPLPLSQTMPLFSPIYPPITLALAQQLQSRLSLTLFDADTNSLTERILVNDPSNYNAWYCKKKYILTHPQEVNHAHQLQFANHCLGDKAKSFQVWQQKRFLLQLREEGVEEEMDSCRDVLERIDHKNYHAWSFRTWLVTKERLWKEELSFAEDMIEDDTFNNSAWTYRWFLVGKQAEGEDENGRKQLARREVAFVLENMTREKSNRASWNYLRGLFPSIKLKGIPCKNAKRGPLIDSYLHFPQIEKACQLWWQELKNSRPQQQESPTKVSQRVREREREAAAKLLAVQREVLCTLVHVYSEREETRHFAVTLCGELAQLQKQRGFYWKWVQNHLA